MAEIRGRLVIAIPALKKVRLSSSAAGLHSRLTHDESADLRWYIAATTGQGVALASDESTDGFERVLATAHALDISRRVLTWMLELYNFGSESWTGTVLNGPDVLDAVSNAVTRTALAEMRADVLKRLQRGDDDGRELIRVSTHPGLTWTPEPYDFFISYKHMLHPDLARDLARALRGRGFRCFLDVDDLTEQVVQHGLHVGLRAALAASRCCVFFETVAQSVAGQQVAGTHEVASVHTFELRHAPNTLFVRLRPPAVYSRQRTLHTGWSTTDELADVLVRLASDDHSPVTADPDLEDVIQRVNELVGTRLGSRVKVAPLAALAIAAPASVNVSTMQSFVGTGETVLRTLLRNDVTSSLALEEAGIPPLAYSAATAGWPDGRWAVPLASVLDGWSSGVVASVHDRVNRTGLDEAALAMGVLGAARAPTAYPGYPGQAVRRSLAALPSPDGQPSEAHVQLVIQRAFNALARGPAGPRHSWVSVPASNTQGFLVATSWSGPYQVATDPAPSLYVLARLDPWLFPLEKILALREAIEGALCGDEASRAHVRLWAPEIAFTIDGRVMQIPVVDVSPGEDNSLLVATLDGARGTDVLRRMLPQGLRRAIHTASVTGLPANGDARPVVLPDRLALWDLLARAAERARCHALDEAQLPRAPGDVLPTSTATSPASLWPPIE